MHASASILDNIVGALQSFVAKHIQTNGHIMLHI
jgi:hypothetical protein